MAKKKILNIDEPSQDIVLLTTYGGLKTAITTARVHELLRIEQEYFSLLGERKVDDAGPDRPAEAPKTPLRSEAPPRPVRRHSFDASSLPKESVTHASLSTRIKKTYSYSAQSRRLREAHLGFLRDLIQNFDWVIPEHPNTKLEQHLLEMIGWRDVPDDFRDMVMRFLDQYLKARKRGA